MFQEAHVEIAMTEAFRLRIEAPVRTSAEPGETPEIVLEDPRGACSIGQGVICALRHIHMMLEDLLSYDVKDRDVVRVQVDGE